MKRKRFSEEQIAFALRQAESGTTIEEICRKLGVSEPTFYRWRKVYAGMGVAEIRRLKQLEDENAKLKRVLADLTLDKAMLQDSCEKMVRPAIRREIVHYLQKIQGRCDLSIPTRCIETQARARRRASSTSQELLAFLIFCAINFPTREAALERVKRGIVR